MSGTLVLCLELTDVGDKGLKESTLGWCLFQYIPRNINDGNVILGHFSKTCLVGL